MKVINDLLYEDDGTQCQFEKDIKYGGDLAACEYIVMHCTTGPTAQSAISSFHREGLSTHLVIDRDGTVTQCVPFNKIAWHTGSSQWADKGYRAVDSDNLSNYSIGIEMVNWEGDFYKVDDHWVKQKKISLPDEDIFFGISKHGYPVHGCGWQKYPPEQIEKAVEVVKALVAAYSETLLDVVGHEDIKKEWENGEQVFFKNDKQGDPNTDREDPGPAFPMASFRARVLALQEGAPEDFEVFFRDVVPDYRWLIDQPELYGRNWKQGRTGPKALASHDIVQVVERKDWWAKVVAKNPDGSTFEGWMPERYLKRIPPPVKEKEALKEKEEIVAQPQAVIPPVNEAAEEINKDKGKVPKKPHQPPIIPV